MAHIAPMNKGCHNRVQSVNHGRLYPSPAGGNTRQYRLPDQRIAHPNSDTHAENLESNSCRPAQAVNFVHSSGLPTQGRNFGTPTHFSNCHQVLQTTLSRVSYLPVY